MLKSKLKIGDLILHYIYGYGIVIEETKNFPNGYFYASKPYFHVYWLTGRCVSGWNEETLKQLLVRLEKNEERTKK